jgi:hypothetical protein
MLLALAGHACACAGDASAPSHPGGDAAQQPEVPERWQDALEQQNNAAYSLSFFESGPSSVANDWTTLGVYLRVAAFLGRDGSACEDFERKLDAREPADLWVLRFEISEASPGEYPIAPTVPHPPPQPMSSARLERWSAGQELERRLASGGVVRVSRVNREPAGWLDSDNLAAEAELEFPEQNVQTNGCGGVMTGSAAASECECIDADGTLFRCMVTPEQPDCCQAAAQGRHSVRISLDAVPCSALCQSEVPHEPSCGQLGR